MTQDEIRDLFESAQRVFPKGWDNYGPDAAFLEVRIAVGEKVVVLRSWHQIEERNPNVAVTSKGVVPLNGRDRFEVKEKDDFLYRKQELTFNMLILNCRSMQAKDKMEQAVEDLKEIEQAVEKK